MPKPVLYALLGLSALMIVGPWLLMGIQRMNGKSKPRRMTTDEREVAERAEKAGGVPLGSSSVVLGHNAVRIELGPDSETTGIDSEDIVSSRNPDGSGSAYIGKFWLGRLGPRRRKDE